MFGLCLRVPVVSVPMEGIFEVKLPNGDVRQAVHRRDAKEKRRQEKTRESSTWAHEMPFLFIVFS